MTPEQAAKLREPFPAEFIGKLPRVWCKNCRDAKQFRHCSEHELIRCGDCKQKITSAHLHLDFVGHAETTDRLLHVDPEWTWEPFGVGADGLPAMDRNGGLWIRLTVAGVTRPGYGHAGDKPGGDAIKEAIGDAIRNAAMRFGVALDLWGASFKDADDSTPTDGVADRQAEREVFDAPPKLLDATSPAGEIRAAIKAAGEAKSLTIKEIAEGFHEWSKGEQIGSATPEVLFEYLQHLTRAVAA